VEAVIKVGGSLAKSLSLKKLCKVLERISKNHKYMIVPGGGEFADVVRDLDKRFHISATISHKMAILAMDQYGLFLSDLMNAFVTSKLREPRPFPKKPVIFLPSRHMFEKNPLPNSWDVTSDSIATYVACKLGVKKLILIKDVDGIYSFDPKKNSNAKLIKKISAKKLLVWNKKTCVDKFLPKILLKSKIRCYIVNGKCPERVEEALEDRLSIGTIID